MARTRAGSENRSRSPSRSRAEEASKSPRASPGPQKATSTPRSKASRERQEMPPPISKGGQAKNPASLAFLRDKGRQSRKVNPPVLNPSFVDKENEFAEVEDDPSIEETLRGNIQASALQEHPNDDTNSLRDEHVAEGMDDDKAHGNDRDDRGTDSSILAEDEREHRDAFSSSEDDGETPEITGVRQRAPTPDSPPTSPVARGQSSSFKSINNPGSQFSSTLTGRYVSNSQHEEALHNEDLRTDGRSKSRTSRPTGKPKQSQSTLDSTLEGSRFDDLQRQSSEDASTTRGRKTKEQSKQAREQLLGSWHGPADRFDQRMMSNMRREFFCTLGSKENFQSVITHEVTRLKRTYKEVPDWIIEVLVDENTQKFNSRCATWKSRTIQNFSTFIDQQLDGNKNFARISDFNEVAESLSEMWDTDQFKMVFRFAESIVMDEAAEQWARYVWGLLGAFVRMNRKWSAQEDRRAIDDYSDASIQLRFNEIGRAGADDIRPRWKNIQVIEPLYENMSRQKKEQKLRLAPLSEVTTWRPGGMKPNVSAAKSANVLPNNASSKTTNNLKRATNKNNGRGKSADHTSNKRPGTSTDSPSKRPRKER